MSSQGSEVVNLFASAVTLGLDDDHPSSGESLKSPEADGVCAYGINASGTGISSGGY